MLKFRDSLSVAALLLSLGLTAFGQVAGQNINMVSGTTWPSGDPFLQRQNEPSMAVSSRNPEHLLGGANDYRTVDIPDPQAPNILGDAWVGVYTSIDGGETWKSTLLPGYPQDTSATGMSSPLHNFTVATDPTVRAGTHGLFYYSGLVFNRAANSASGVFVATLQDRNNKGNGDSAILLSSGGTTHGNPFQYVNVNLVDTGTSGQFLDKPWIVVDVPRAGRTATCTVGGQTFSSGYVYVVYTQFNGSNNNPASKIKFVTSTNCGKTWGQPQVLSQSQKLAQGTVAAIDPGTGNVFIAWRQIASGNQPDAIQWSMTSDGGNTFSSGPAVYTFTAPTASNPFPPGAAFDQPQANSTTFRSLDVPALAVDGTGRAWLAFSVRVNGPTAGSYGSRIQVMTLPKGGSNKSWTPAYVADSTAPSTQYGHQFMPSFSFAFGKLMLAWFDSRRDNLQSVLKCPSSQCSDLSQLNAQDIPIPGSTISNPATVFTPYLSDPNSGVRHTIDVYGSVIDPSNGPANFPGFRISQYSYYVDDANQQIEQGFFNPPNLPMFVKGTTPFIGDYIDIAAQTMQPSGNTWIFNTAGKDTKTGATFAPDFHVTWTDNRDVVPPPVVGGSQDWTQYTPPNSGATSTSVYSGTGSACPTCTTTQPACTTVQPDNGGISAYSGDRNQNVYTSRISNGLIVRFKENSKPLSSTVPQRSFSLLVKNTVSPLSTTPLDAPSFYRILLGTTSTSQAPSCAVSGGTASFATTMNCYLDVAVNPKTTLAQVINVASTVANPSVTVLVAKIQSIPAPGSTPVYLGLQDVAVINGDPSNPAVADPDFLTTDNSNPDVSAPNSTLPIASGEEYDPTVDGPPDPTSGIFTPKIGTPDIFTPKIGTPANSAPAIQTPSVFTPKITDIFTPKIASVQVANPTIVDTIFTPKIFTPKIFTPKIVSPDIFTPKITSLSDSGTNSITDYSWRVTNKGNTSASYSTKELAKSAGVTCCPAACSANPNSCAANGYIAAGTSCSVCQLVQHKVYESPIANRDTSNNLNPTCDLNVQQENIVVSNITDPAFTTGGGGVGSASDPTNSTLALGPGEGNRVTLRVVSPPVNQTVSPFKTVATSFNNDKGKSGNATSLTIATAVLPVAVVGQAYVGTSASAVGGYGALAWSVPVDPSNPVAAALPVTPQPVASGLPILLNQAGGLSTALIPFGTGTGTYTANLQVQDTASTPSLDVQQVPLLVNQLTIASVNLLVANQVGSTGYINAGDTVSITVTINNQGPAVASSVVPRLSVKPLAAGTPSGPAPNLSCSAPVGATQIMGGSSGVFTFTCNNASGNGYVTFNVSATGAYVNSAGSVAAVATDPSNNNATTVSEPVATPSGTPPNVIVDTTKPNLAFNNANPPANQYAWNNTPVTFTFTTSDNLAGVNTSVPNPLVLSSEGKNLSGSVKVTDWANNSGTFTAPTTSMPQVNIDLTPPSIAVTSTYTPNTWTNQNVTVMFTCTDSLSGPIYTSGLKNPVISGVPASGATVSYNQTNALTTVATVTLSAETTGTTLSAACQDYAGNNAVPVQFGQILIDKTPPQLGVSAVTPSGPYAAGTWTNQNVTVTYSCVDTASPVSANSGVAGGYPQGSNSFTQETSSGSSTGTCVDVAGNAAVPLGFGPVQIDKTPPVLTVAATTPSGAYPAGTWTNQAVTVTYSCTDSSSALANSGVAAGSPQGNAVFNTEISNGSTTGTCTDVAGNAAVPLPFGPVKIDLTPPVVTATATLNSSTGPTYTANTWTNQSVIVNFACTDSLSGVQNGSLTGNTTYGSQGSYTANGSCKDVAGNTGTGSFGPVLIDTTTPSVVITSPQSQAYILNQQITPSFSCPDNGGGDNATCTATPSGSPYTASAVGPATFSVHAVDDAGNATNPDPSTNYVVVYNFTGFQAPLQPAVFLNQPNPPKTPQPSDSGSFVVGTVIPLAWQLQDATNTFISDPATLTSIAAVPSPSCTGSVTLYGPSVGHSLLTYDSANDRFVFTWDTTGLASGCYQIVVTTNDTAQWSTIVHIAADNFVGFDAPLAKAAAPASPSASSSFDAGATVPLMWQLQLPNGTPDSGQAVTPTNVTAYPNGSCSGGAAIGNAGTVLYDFPSQTGTIGFEPSTAVYTLNWVTTTNSSGCFDVVVTLSDGSLYATRATLAPVGGPTTLVQYNFDNVPQGAASQTAPASYVAPFITADVFGYSRSYPNGMSTNGCDIALCIDPSGVAFGEYYSFSFSNTGTVSNASISFSEFNNDCQVNNTPCNGQSFSVQYSTTADFSSGVTTISSFTPPEPGSQKYTFPIPGTLPAGTYYFRITATGNDSDSTAQYILDDVTISGSHSGPSA